MESLTAFEWICGGFDGYVGVSVTHNHSGAGVPPFTVNRYPFAMVL